MLAGALAAFAATFADAAWRRHRDTAARAVDADLARELQVTDVCLFTDARYTRHLSQADLNSAFQDYPGAREHMPSGSLVEPPR